MSRRNGRLGRDIGGRVREPGASPGRSRRCEGRRCPATMPLARRWEGGGAGSPESEDLPPVDPNPSWKEDSCFDAPSCSPWSLGLVLAIVGSASAAVVRVRVEGKSQTIFGADATARVGGYRSRRTRVRQRRPASSTTTSSRPASGRTSIRSAAIPPRGSSGWAFKVNGASPPVGADKVEVKDGDVVLWYWATSPMPAARRRSSSPAPGTAATGSGPERRRQMPSPTSATLRVDARRVAMDSGRACPALTGASCARLPPARCGRMR